VVCGGRGQLILVLICDGDALECGLEVGGVGGHGDGLCWAQVDGCAEDAGWLVKREENAMTAMCCGAGGSGISGLPGGSRQ
jgi:hypothetical protein